MKHRQPRLPSVLKNLRFLTRYKSCIRFTHLMETGLYVGVHGKGVNEFYRAALCTRSADGTLVSHLDNHVYGCSLREVLEQALTKAQAPLRLVNIEPVDRDPRSTEDFKSFTYHNYRPLTAHQQETAQLLLKVRSGPLTKQKDNKHTRATAPA